jgi:hypothetical protein
MIQVPSTAASVVFILSNRSADADSFFMYSDVFRIADMISVANCIDQPERLSAALPAPFRCFCSDGASTRLAATLQPADSQTRLDSSRGDNSSPDLRVGS